MGNLPFNAANVTLAKRPGHTFHLLVIRLIAYLELHKRNQLLIASQTLQLPQFGASVSELIKLVDQTR